MNNNSNNIEEFGINTVRILAVDAVQKANSGHPGTPMGIAPIGHILWTRFMNYNPGNPDWVNRDRFILSPGHACMFQYSYLYLTGYNLTLEDLKLFRQLHSKTAGHPEYGLLEGIEVTTGPLGQGFANGVGFAIAQKHLANRFNKPNFPLFDYTIYAIVSDGDMMEGITSEAASLAGHLGLGNLIYIYDDNNISIEGNTNLSFTEDVGKRFEAYNWHVLTVGDGNDLEALDKAIRIAKLETTKPTLIKVRTQIAYGSPNKAGTAGAHGSPLGVEEVKLVKKFFGFDPEKSFEVNPDVLAYYRDKGARGIEKEQVWNKLLDGYKIEYPELANEFERLMQGKLPLDWEKSLPIFSSTEGKMATRQASGKVLNAVATLIPELLGGSADLAPSTDTNLKAFDSYERASPGGRNFHFGIREHAMGAILNGMSLTKGLIPYGATFLIFSEYMRPPIRLAAIMKINPIFIYTHDSIGVGEDGTTHQPVEQLISLRSIPNITLIRPADANETSQAWKVALEHKTGPVILVFTRQVLPIIDTDFLEAGKFASKTLNSPENSSTMVSGSTRIGQASQLKMGAYILRDSTDQTDKIQILLVASGSEVSLILSAQEQLNILGIHSRVVSMPSWELFEKQDSDYKEKVFPKNLRKRIAVEMASPLGWHKYVTDEGTIIAMNSFGESGPAESLYREFGFTIDNIVTKAKILLSN